MPHRESPIIVVPDVRSRSAGIVDLSFHVQLIASIVIPRIVRYGMSWVDDGHSVINQSLKRVRVRRLVNRNPKLDVIPFARICRIQGARVGCRFPSSPPGQVTALVVDVPVIIRRVAGDGSLCGPVSARRRKHVWIELVAHQSSRSWLRIHLDIEQHVGDIGAGISVAECASKMVVKQDVTPFRTTAIRCVGELQ